MSLEKSGKHHLLRACVCLIAVQGVRRFYLWYLNRRLPTGIRFSTDGLLGSNGHYVVEDLALLKQHAKVLVHPTAGARVYMGGVREKNILCAPAGAYERQRMIIHPFITTHSGQYLSLLKNTELVLKTESGQVNLLEEVGKYVAHISTGPMGLKLRHGFSWQNVSKAVLGIGVLLGFGFSERLLRYILRCFLPFTALEQQIAEFVDKSDSKFVRDLIVNFGRHETIGHIWGVINGSIIPETNMICSIMRELAAKPESQEAVHAMICEDTMETLLQNKQFDEWILRKCREHAFFRSTSRIAEEAFVYQGHKIPKGASLRIPIAKLNDLGASLTWGFGRRSCPGAQIGKNIIKFVVFRIVRYYRVHLEREPFNLKTDTVNMFPYGMSVSCVKRMPAAAAVELPASPCSVDEQQ